MVLSIFSWIFLVISIFSALWVSHPPPETRGQLGHIEKSLQILCPLLKILGCFLWLSFNCTSRVFRVLHIFLKTSILLGMCFANIFSLSTVCLSILLTVPFEEQKFLILIKSTFSIYYFMDHDFGVRVWKPLPNPRLQRFFSYVFFYKFYSFKICI